MRLIEKLPIGDGKYLKLYLSKVQATKRGGGSFNDLVLFGNIPPQSSNINK